MDQQTLGQRTVSFVKLAAGVLQHASRAATEKQAQDARVAKLVPQAVKACLDNGRIRADEQEKLAAALSSHEDALYTLMRLASQRLPGESPLGAPAKQASAATAAHPARNRQQLLHELNRKAFAAAGLPPPSDEQ